MAETLNVTCRRARAWGRWLTRSGNWRRYLWWNCYGWALGTIIGIVLGW